jgi:hypothetical protein
MRRCSGLYCSYRILRDTPCARKRERCKMAHAFLRGCSCKRLARRGRPRAGGAEANKNCTGLAQIVGQP